MMKTPCPNLSRVLSRPSALSCGASIGLVLLLFLAGSAPVGANDEPCPTVGPVGWRIEVGFGAGEEVDARRQAIEDASQRLVDRVCADITAAQCDGIRGAMSTWRSHYDPETATACASLAVPAEALQQLEIAAAGLELALDSLGERIAQQRTGLVVLDPPIWGQTGCSAAEAGVFLKDGLEARLGQVDGLQIAADEVSAASATRIQLLLANGPTDVQINARIVVPGAAGTDAVVGPSFPRELFGLAMDSENACAGDLLLGLHNGRRDGHEGLEVWIELPDNRFCEGDAIAPVVRVNRLARVQVFDVTRDGVAYLLWPVHAHEGVVMDTLSLGQMFFESDPDQGDERLVAMAIVPDRSFAESNSWQAYCRLPHPFSPDLYPAGAAVGTATFIVVPAGRGGCPVRDIQNIHVTGDEASLCQEEDR